MTGPPLPVSRGHAPARRELSGSDGGHRSGGQRAPQSGGAAKASTERERTLSVGRKTPQSAGTVEFLRHRRGSAATWTGAERQRWRLPRAAAAAAPPRSRGGSESAARTAPRTTPRPPAAAAADLRHEIGDLLGVLAVDEVGRHLALAAGAALLDRVDDERLRRVELVEVRADLAHGVRRRERVARRAPLGEDLAPALVRGGQLHAAGRLLGAPRGGDHQRRDKNPEQQHQHANADGHRAPAAPRRPARALGVPPPTAERGRDDHEPYHEERDDEGQGGDHRREHTDASRGTAPPRGPASATSGSAFEPLPAPSLREAHDRGRDRAEVLRSAGLLADAR